MERMETHQGKENTTSASVFKLTSLEFVKFTSDEKHVGAERLIRDLKDVERELIQMIKMRDNSKRKLPEEERRFYKIYLKLGHINLLAQDFAKALSAYQKAYKHNKEDFWKDPAALYGLGFTYFHFRAYYPAIELFCQLLFSHPYSEVTNEVNARLGLCFKALENYTQAFKHLNIALDDARECAALPKSFLRFQIAHCLDISGEVRKAVDEYRRLLADNDRGILPLSNQLLSAIYARLGWISLCSRERESKEELKLQKLKEAEALLQRAREYSPVDSKANCYLGLCYSEQTRVANKLESDQQQQQQQSQAHPSQQLTNAQFLPRYNADQAAQNAFISYRTAIDSDESDANTWRSIGVLYQQQNQPIDALQAFACAVQLNDKHFAAWVDLGQLYEKHRQYKETLFCYKKALQADPEPPEQLRARIAVIEKELSQIGGPLNYSLLAQQQSARRGDSLLPSIESAWQLGIPSQVRQRLADLKKQQENKYREGSPLFGMHDLIANSMTIDADDRSLTPTQRQILQILKMNKDQLEVHESTLLQELEQRDSDEPGGQEAVEKQAAEADDGQQQRKQQQQQSLMPAINQQDLDNLLGEAKQQPQQQQPPPGTGKGGADPATTANNSNTANLVFPSSMLSPKEEVSAGDGGEQQPKATTTAADGHDQQQQQQIQEEKISSSSHPAELPPNFSLLAPVHLPVTVTSAEVLEMCKKRLSKPEEYKPIFDENVPPPKAPVPPSPGPSKEKLLLKTPVVLVENQRDAMALELQQFCYTQPIVLVHGLTMALKIDLSQFSTKTLIQTAAEHEVEVRTQYKMPYDVNVDQMGKPTWSIRSSKGFTTISRYGQYQAESFKHSLKEETEKLRQANPKLYGPAVDPTPAASLPDGSSPVPTKKRKTAAGTPTSKSNAGGGNEENNPYRMIKFGTNVDLSDEKKFYFQLRELNKLPPFCRIASASNMLSYLNHTVLGMNTVQLYLKVPGCRTPGHLENNCFASVNVNIGPGECEWFGVPYDYWPTIERMCKERGIDFLRGAWWPNVADLVKEDIPFYRFTQRAGDMVWVNGGCVHWVQSTGWCNNVAWNVGPMTANQMEMSLTAHEWNKLNSYRSLVPMQHLCWSLARDVRFSNQKLYNQVKNMLIRSLAYCQMLVDFVGTVMKSPIKKQQRQKGECAHYCQLCEVEVFNLLFVKEIGGKWKIFCVQCARRNNLDDYVVLQQYPFEELQLIFDRFQLHPAKSSLIC